MPFEATPLDIPEVLLIKPGVFEDERGSFMESYKDSDFKNKLGIKEDFKQDNHSVSKKNVLRGLHFQLAPREQGKLVRVIKGAVFDVAVDLRVGSPTYLKWVGAEISAENQMMLWVPPGFAHGFLTLEDETNFLYKVTNEYSHEHDSGIFYNDPEIGIEWPIPENQILLSDKDRKLPPASSGNQNFKH